LGCTLQYTKFKPSDNGVCSAHLYFENCLEEVSTAVWVCFYRQGSSNWDTVKINY